MRVKKGARHVLHNDDELSLISPQAGDKWDSANFIVKINLDSSENVIAGFPADIDGESLEESLSKAVKNGNIGKVSELISQGVDINVKLINANWMPLHEAALQGHDTVVALLLQVELQLIFWIQ